MSLMLLIPIFLTLILINMGLPRWIRKCKQIGMIWKDMNKYGHPRNVAASGGLIVIISFTFGILSYLAIRSLLLNSFEINIALFAILGVILILSLIGLLDDLCGWKYGGLSIKTRLFFALMASIPLIIIKAGETTMNIPFFGVINFGIFYTFVIVPIALVGTTTTFNFLAGFNGLETGQGIIILSFLSFVAYMTGSSWLAFVGLLMVLPLIIFYIYNKYPAKVFPGDSLTWSIGALIAIMAILGNFEKIALFIFIPYFIEIGLKLRGKLKKQSFAKPNEDNSLEMPYNKIYGLTHLSLFILKRFKKKVYEKDVVHLIFIFQLAIVLLAFVIFKGGMF